MPLFAPHAPGGTLRARLDRAFEPPIERPTEPMWGRSSAGRARRSQCRGQGFDPPRLHQPSLATREKAATPKHEVRRRAQAAASYGSASHPEPTEATQAGRVRLLRLGEPAFGCHTGLVNKSLFVFDPPFRGASLVGGRQTPMVGEAWRGGHKVSSAGGFQPPGGNADVEKSGPAGAQPSALSSVSDISLAVWTTLAEAL
jgi:hypothetical protein